MSFCYINVETKMKKWFFFSNLKKFTSPANEFLLHECRNKNKQKWIFSFSNLKNFTSPANEFLLHNAETNNKYKFSYFSNQKNFTSPADEFLLHKSRNKNDFFFLNLKIFTNKLISFSYKGIAKGIVHPMSYYCIG